MRNIWIVVGIIVIIGLLYFVGRGMFDSPEQELNSIDDLETFTVTPEMTSPPVITATGSPVTSPVLLESPTVSPTGSGAI